MFVNDVKLVDQLLTKGTVIGFKSMRVCKASVLSMLLIVQVCVES